MDFNDLLRGKTALVTGASYGIGRGIAAVLAESGAIVYATGRTIDQAALPEAVRRLRCDHTDDHEVAQVFDRIRRQRGALDVLVTAAWGGYERMVENGTFTWAAPFWEQPTWRWAAMMNAGVRAAFVASQHAAPLMVPAARGLIVHLSHWAAQKPIGNAIYGIAKAATDAMSRDQAHELRQRGVTVLSLYPGLVRTEKVMAAAAVFDLSNSESPEFTGRAVSALAADADAQRWTGQAITSAALALHYGFDDIDGRQPRPLTIADV